MVRAITPLLFFSLLSYAGDNLITIQTQGTGTTITASQAGSSNTTAIYCGLGSFDNSLVGNHTCDSATITVDVTGDSNVAYTQSVWSNHADQTWITTVTGNSNYSVIDMDESGSTSRITQDGDDHQAWILGSGVDNVYKIEQDGESHYGKLSRSVMTATSGSRKRAAGIITPTFTTPAAVITTAPA